MKNSGSKKISERYVVALFDVAQSANSLATTEKDLSIIAAAIKENVDFQEFLTNPLLTRSAQEKIIAELLKKLGVSNITIQFVSLLARHKRLGLLPEIIAIFLEKAAASRGEISAELVVAQSISASESKTIEQSLGKSYNKKINLSVREDKSLLGGAIINIGSVQLDASLVGKLNRLKQELRAA